MTTIPHLSLNNNRMDQHYGHIVEKVIRRNGYSISELARLTNVNRRSVYNWFNQKNLRSEIIYRIGCALNHDFSIEFPSMFSPNEFNNGLRLVKPNVEVKIENNNQNYWKDKYINLMEKYNDLLLCMGDHPEAKY
nr:helix-turn-helix transcriptional regulator [Mucilaginibacter sp. JXJ CY 39]